MINNRVTIALALTISLAMCHPAILKRAVTNETCFSPEPAEITSYHIHLLYWQKSNQSTTGAYQIRDKFREAFKTNLGADCHDLFENDFNCLLDPDYEPAGPFPVAEWSVYVLPGNLEPMQRWFAQHRGDYTVLVHPNSGCEIEDHGIWAGWFGQSYPLDFSIFSHDTPFPWNDESKAFHM